MHKFPVLLPAALAALLLSACATSGLTSNDAANDQGTETGETCKPFAGVFENHGQRYNKREGLNTDGWLAEQVLTRRLPGGVVAQRVAMVSDTGVNLLDAELRGSINQKIAIEISCSDGWHTFVFERTGNYVGDGVVEKRFRHAASYRLDEDGNLVAKVQVDVEYEEDYSKRTMESSENWFQFSPAD